MKIIFVGTPEFGAIILERLCNTEFKPCLVITEPDKPMGRKQILIPPPVKVIARRYNIPVLQPEAISNLKSQISNLEPDLIILAAYGKILPKEILEIPKYGCLNIHPSLLPKYRGASPIQYAILNNEKETGVTIILMDEKIDHGPILAQRELEILNPKFQISNKSQNSKFKITYPRLSKELAELGAKLLIKTIPEWIRGEIKPQPQDESAATYAKILTREDGKVNWEKSADEIERQIRAFQPWPGSWTLWQIAKENLFRIKILKARVFKSPDGRIYPVGKILVVPQNEAAVRCGENFLVIEELQLEGKKPTNSEEFLRGHSDFIAATLQ